MKLVQKMSVGLGLGCLVLLSSCSKEDAQAPEPKVETTSADTTSNMKTNGPCVDLWHKGLSGH